MFAQETNKTYPFLLSPSALSDRPLLPLLDIIVCDADAVVAQSVDVSDSVIDND
jgi:hypothetical protein